MDDFMKDVKITIIEEKPVTENGITYDVEVWLFDHGKKGTAKIIKRTPRSAPEEEIRKNRKEVDRAVGQMALCALQATPEQREAAKKWAKTRLELVEKAERISA